MSIFVGVLSLSLSLIFTFLFMPTLDITEAPGLVLVLLIPVVAFFLLSPKHDFEDSYPFIFVSVLFVFLMKIVAHPVFFHEERFKVLEDSKIEVEASFLSDVNYRMVTKAMAEKKATKILGRTVDGKNISSQYQLGEGSVIIVGNQQNWVFPLEYKSIWKWLDNDQTPGYITIDAQDPEAEAKFVNKPLAIVRSGYFNQNLKRLLWIESGFRSTQTHFETDDAGNPYHVTAVLEKDILYSVPVVTEVIITDASTGEMKTFEINDVPSWVDVILPQDVVQDYLEWNGQYLEGFWNAVFAQSNVTEPSSYNGSELWLVTIDSEQYYLTGMTSPSTADDSLVSLRLVSAQSGEHVIVPLNGMTDEGGAIEATDSKLGADSTRWHPVLPQPKYIDGDLYWATMIVSGSNIYQKAALLNSRNPTEVFFGDTLEKAEQKVLMKVNNSDLSHDETITVNKRAYIELMDKIEEIQSLKESLIH